MAYRKELLQRIEGKTFKVYEYENDIMIQIACFETFREAINLITRIMMFAKPAFVGIFEVDRKGNEVKLIELQTFDK